MKNPKLIIIAGILTLVLLANRFVDSSVASKNEVNIYRQIEKQMPYPEFAKSENLKGKVLVEFRFDNTGHIQILNINYSNKDLRNYVANRLSTMEIAIPENRIDKTYRVEFSFHLIS